MREYNRRSDNVNGYPSFCISEYYGFLYRNGKTGCWMVANLPSEMNTNEGVLRSKSAAELPTQDGLQWQYHATVGLRLWKDDRAIVCEGTNKVPMLETLTLTPILNQHLYSRNPDL